MKIIGNHRDGCYSIEYTKEKFWSNPWAFIPHNNERETGRYGERYTGDALGRRKGNRIMMGQTWFQIVCNDPDCGARLQVSENEILNLLQQEMTDDH